MDLNIKALPILFAILDTVYIFWPLLPLTFIRFKNNGLVIAAFSWLFFGIARTIIIFKPEPHLYTAFIPEPTNSILFLALGFVLLILWIFLGKRKLTS